MMSDRSGNDLFLEERLDLRGLRVMAATLLLITAVNSTAQSPQEADSLWAIWNNTSVHDTSRMRAMDYLAFDHYLFTKPDSAFVLAELLLEKAKATGNDYFQSIAFNTQAASFQVRGDYPRAVEYFRRAMARLKAMGDLRRQSGLHANLGSILDDLGEKDLALAHYDTCLDMSIRTGNELALADALVNSANIIRLRGDTTEALSRYQRSLEISERIAYDRTTALNHSNIGRIQSHRGAYADALLHFEKARTIAEGMNDQRMISMVERESGATLARQGRIKEAIAAGQRSLAISRPANMTAEVHGTANMLYDLYKQAGQLDKALAMHELYAAMADSLHNEKGREEMVRANMRFNFRQEVLADSLANRAKIEGLEAERALAQERVSNQRSRFIGGGVMLLLLVGGATYIYVDRRQRRAKAEREHAIQLERMRIASDMHDDLGSGLSALRIRGELAQRSQSPSEVQRHLASITDQAVDIISNMRHIIWAMDNEGSDLRSTLDHCFTYATGYLSENNLRCTVERIGVLPDLQLSPQQRRNLFLVVKECLHNTVKHAKATEVRIHCAWNAGLHLSFQDDGQAKQMPDPGTGRGVTNMQKRIGELGGSIEFRAQNGMRIDVTLPFGHANEHAIAAGAQQNDLRGHAR